MNLNVAEIVNVKLYDQLQHAELPAAGTWLSISEGEFVDVQGQTQKYAAGVRKAEDGQLLVMVKTPYFTFSGLEQQRNRSAGAGESDD